MNDITQVYVQNFQSIGEATIDLGAFTVIVGHGNLGKSALLRAISAAIFNENGAGNIRFGQKECHVRIAFENAPTVEWVKDEKSAHYEFDGMTYTKLAGGVPESIRNAFDIREIEIDKTFSMSPQIHGQWDQPLLLAESPGKAARALAKLTKLEIIVQAQVAAARDRRRAAAEAASFEREVADLAARLDKLPDITGATTRLETARGWLHEADTALNRLADAEDAVESIRDAERRLAVSVPHMDDLGARIDRLQNGVIVKNLVDRANAAVVASMHAEADADQALYDAQTELRNFEEKLKVCPLCGQPYEVDHVD